MARLDFNTAPYNDDYQASRNYMKVLFRSGRPVQARELNNIQSSFQNQIEQFANHIFKNGSKVSNARCALSAKAYARLRPYVSASNPPVLVNVEQFAEGTALKGAVSGVTATLVKAINATGPEGTIGADPATLYIVYTGTGIDGQRSTFIPGETVNILDENGLTVYQVDVRCPSCSGSSETDTIPPIGQGQIFTIDEGVFYYEGMFLQVPRQDILVHKYLIKDEDNAYPAAQKMDDGTIAPLPCKIGLDMVQTIVTFQDDPSLLDPSLGYPNSTAPGADRYKVELRLVKRSYESEDGENFILLCRIGEQMLIEYMKSDSEYSDIMDMIAKRTYETNGNYTIRPFKVSFYESKKLNNSDAQGWSLTGDPAKVVALVTPSVGYVKGYRVETINNTPVQIPKARDTKKISGFIKQFPERTYIVLQPTSSKIWPNDDSNPGTIGLRQLSLYNVSDVLIGSCYVSDMKHHATVSGNRQYRYYIYNLTMVGSNLLSDVVKASTDTSFAANVVVDPVSGKFDVYNANQAELIFPIDKTNVKSLRDVDDSTKGSIAITVRKKLTGFLDSSEQIVFNATTNQSFLPASNRMIIWVTDGGTIRTIDALGAGVVTSTGTTLTVNCTNPSNPGQNASKPVTILADILLTSQQEKKKELADGTYNSSVAPSMLAGAISVLPDADVQSFKVFLVQGVLETEITDEYTLDQGFTDVFYGSSKVVRKTANSRTIVGTDRLKVTYKYYQHTGTQGYFTIDSYPVDAILNPIDYEEVPTFTLTNKVQVKGSNAFDFRPVVLDTATSATSIAATLPAGESTAIFDIEYFLARTDLLQIDKEGKLYIKMGNPSETPRPPKQDENAMALYEIWLQPYTYDLNDISTRFLENKRYTMRDIGRLEKRIENVEYYTVLNLLEKSAADMSIKDEDGFDRFKNGFIADNFADFQAAELGSPEFKASVDRGVRELRPQFKTANKKLVATPQSSSNNVRWHGNVAMLDYSEVQVDSNPYATKHISINPYYQYNKRGQLALSPNNDVWSDETRLPAIVTDIDTGVEEFRRLASAAGVLGTDWGSWIDQNRTILGTTVRTNTVTRNTTTSSAVVSVTSNVTTTNTTTSTNQIRHGVNTTVESRTNEYTIEDIVKDVQVIPYIREIDIEFYASKLKPNTQVYAFFDGVKVSEFCRSINFQLSADNSNAQDLISYGSTLISDGNGELIGTFRVPAGRFFVGEKRFKLSDDPSGNSDPDVESTSCETSFFAGGLDVTRQDQTLNIITPTFDTEEVSETRTVVTTTTQRESEIIDVTETPLPDPPEPPACETIQCYCARHPSSWKCSDPVAQAFITSREMFVTSLEVFFKQIDPLNDKLFVELRTMNNGYPSGVVLGRKNFDTSDIRILAGSEDAPIVSEDSTVPLRVTFDIPVYLEANTQYCFVVGGFSPNTRIWLAHLGQEVVNIPGKIVEIPPTGQSSFRSVNGSTWNAEQFETIKYNLFAAEFVPGTMELGFSIQNIKKDAFWMLEENPIETEAGSNQVRVYARDHGFSENDTVGISLFDDVKIVYEAAELPPQIGQVLVAASGDQAVIHDIVEKPSEPGVYEITVREGVGDFAMASNSDTKLSVTVPAIQGKKVRDPSILEARQSKTPKDGVTLNAANGMIRKTSGLVGTKGSAYPVDNLAGIPIKELNKNHLIVKVDSQDSFIIQVDSNSTFSGRSGGTTVRSYQFNEKYDVFNVSGTYIPYRSTELWNLEGIGYARLGSPFEGSDGVPMEPITFLPGQDRFLGRPFKIVSADPESITVNVQFGSVGSYTSPVVNTDTFSVTTISNRSEWISETDFNTEPNSSGRFVTEDDPIKTLQGTETYKYVTQNVLLKDPANDLHVFFDVYRDKDADFDVYIKKAAVYEERSLDDIPWTKAVGIIKNRYSVDLTDRIEYEIIGSENVPNWNDGAGDPIPFVAFKIKLVGRSKNSSKPVLFRSLRGIAVT